jgi:hypothetical protein
MSDKIMYLLIARAVDSGPDGYNAEVRLGYLNEPPQEDIEDIISALLTIYEEAFGEPAVRTGYAVLPWVNELDGDSDG